MKRISIYIFCFNLFLLNALIFAENQVIVKNIDWKITSTENFDIYYYRDSEPLLPYASVVLEKAYKNAIHDLNPNLQKRIPFFLFASINDMEQNTIAQVSDGIGGLTEPLKDRFMVWSDGSKSWLEDVIFHEFAHEAQFSVMIDGFWKSARILKTYVYPLWMMEGIAEYNTQDRDIAMEELYVRDAALDKKLISLEKLHGFSYLKPHQTTLAYKTSSAAIRFLASEYGKDKPALMMYYYRNRYDINSVLQPLIGLDIKKFDEKFKKYQEIKFSIQVQDEKLKEANEDFKITGQPDDLPDFNLSPVYSQKRKEIIYISTLEGHPPAIVFKNIETGKTKILDYSSMDIENIPYSRFTKPLRSLSISSSGKYLVFSAQKNHREYLCIYDLEKDSFSKFQMKGFLEARQFSFSPDDSKIAFVAMKNAFNDIYVIPFNQITGLPEIEKAKNITNDEKDQSSPTWTKSGDILFTQEEGEFGLWRRTLNIYEEGKGVRTIIDFEGQIYDSVEGKDGIYFTAEYEKNFSLFLFNRKDLKIYRLFHPVGGIFTPYIHEDEIYFSLFRHGCINIYRYPLDNFELEPITCETIYPKISQNDEKISFLTTGKKPSPAPSLDLFFPALMFSSPGGLFLFNYSRFSDMLGRHTIDFFINYNSGWPYINSSISYLYSRYRTKFFFQSSIYSIDSLKDSDNWKYDKHYTRNLAGILYPFDRYRRGEFYLIEKDDSKNYYYPIKFKDKTRSRAIQLSYVKDNISGLYLSAIRGSKFSLSWQKGFEIAGGDQKYDVYETEYLKYMPMSRKSPFINRFYAGFSTGRDRRSFDFGGVNGLRGYQRGGIENENSRVLNYNVEARFFLSKMDYYMWYFFPDFYFKAIYFKVFSDNAYGWDYKSQLSSFSVGDIKNSVGIGLDFHAFVLQTFQMVMSFDWAVRTDDGNKIFYFYLGPLF